MEEAKPLISMLAGKIIIKLEQRDRADLKRVERGGESDYGENLLLLGSKIYYMLEYEDMYAT